MADPDATPHDDASDARAYWCYTHQQVEPVSWLPHPDHKRVGPMTRADAHSWREGATPWAAEVLPLDG